MTFIQYTYHPGGSGPLPTVLAIHGHGANGQDLLGLGPLLAGGRLLVICPEAEFQLQPGMPSYTWFRRDDGGQRTPEEFERVATAVRAFADEAIPHAGGDPSRVVLLGFSQGGSLAYHLGLAEPKRWRGLAALSTWLPDEAAEAADTDGLGALPVLVQHGSTDPAIEVARARQSRDRLEELGAKPDYREYGMGHQIGPESLTDLSRWLERVLELPPLA
ncbi:MAG: alpha/beta hydrolase fold domain-containing protein [Chloroflexi bacterium]|nr:alpha/beta hydrolase fold domain-containing protein [Chloroflexota bacterium]MDA1240942.1 alpha/beta hydrolase fold domain-containing protein [Chloroflexota bacterium]